MKNLQEKNCYYTFPANNHYYIIDAQSFVKKKCKEGKEKKVIMFIILIRI